jgi:hypothetical protein
MGAAAAASTWFKSEVTVIGALPAAGSRAGTMMTIAGTGFYPSNTSTQGPDEEMLVTVSGLRCLVRANHYHQTIPLGINA